MLCCTWHMLIHEYIWHVQQRSGAHERKMCNVCVCVCVYLCVCVCVCVHVCVCVCVRNTRAKRTRSVMRHDSFIMWHDLHMCDTAHSLVRHDSFILWNDSCILCHDSFICVTWLVHMWHDSFKCVPWLIHWRHIVCTRHASSPWLIHMCAMTHSYVCHDSFNVCHVSFNALHDWVICVQPPRRR